MKIKINHIILYAFVLILSIILIICSEKYSQNKIDNSIVVNNSTNLNLKVNSFEINRGWIILNDVYYVFKNKNGDYVEINKLKKINDENTYPIFTHPFILQKKQNNDTLFFIKDDVKLYKTF